METVKTRFIMSGVPTYVTVEMLREKTYGCTLNLVDFFDHDEIPADPKAYDLTVTSSEDGTWHVVGESKVHLKPEDIQSLGKAITEL
jgi:hypothetical protein